VLALVLLLKPMLLQSYTYF